MLMKFYPIIIVIITDIICFKTGRFKRTLINIQNKIVLNSALQ